MNHRPCHFCQEFQFFSFEPFFSLIFITFLLFTFLRLRAVGSPTPCSPFLHPPPLYPSPSLAQSRTQEAPASVAVTECIWARHRAPNQKARTYPFLPSCPVFFLTLFGAFFWFLFLARAPGKEKALTSKVKRGERGLDKKGNSVQTTKSQSCSHSHR